MELDKDAWTDERRSEGEEGGCLIKRLSNLEENRLAICWAPVTPSTQGAMDFLTRFSRLTSHQNWSFFRDVKELQTSRIRYSFLRLSWRRTAYLNLLFVLRLMLKRTRYSRRTSSLNPNFVPEDRHLSQLSSTIIPTRNFVYISLRARARCKLHGRGSFSRGSKVIILGTI